MRSEAGPAPTRDLLSKGAAQPTRRGNRVLTLSALAGDGATELPEGAVKQLDGIQAKLSSAW